MENLSFSFNSVIGLLGCVIALCVYIANRLMKQSDTNEKRIDKLEKIVDKHETCFFYVKRDIEELKR